MIDNLKFAEKAASAEYTGIPYEKLDCQAFVEKVLSACGYNHNWRGSNDMWRNALSWSGTYDDALKKFGKIPVGAWLFTLKNDGKEKDRGYTDGINAAHVGIYVGDGKARHSTSGGVQFCAAPAARWTHVGLASVIDYHLSDVAAESTIFDIIESVTNLQKEVERLWTLLQSFPL